MAARAGAVRRESERWGRRPAPGGADGRGAAVMEALRGLRGHGVGARVQRARWGPECFWTVHDVRPAVDGRRGKVWGVLTWDGVEDPRGRQRVRGALKKVWAPLPAPGDAAGAAWQSVDIALAEAPPGDGEGAGEEADGAGAGAGPGEGEGK